MLACSILWAMNVIGRAPGGTSERRIIASSVNHAIARPIFRTIICPSWLRLQSAGVLGRSPVDAFLLVSHLIAPLRSCRNDGAASLARPCRQWQGKECRGWEQADFEALLRDRAGETRRARR